MNDDQLIMLGFPSISTRKELFHRCFFPSKIGGKPAWLDPQNFPLDESAFSCESCKTPLTYILQIYAPRDNPNAFHRMIYLFGCCNCGNNFKVYRCQLARYNQFYPAYPPDETNISDINDSELENKCCNFCGIPRNTSSTSYRDEINDQLLKEYIETMPIEKKNRCLPHKRCVIAHKYKNIKSVFSEMQLEVVDENDSTYQDISYQHEKQLYDNYKNVGLENNDTDNDAVEFDKIEEHLKSKASNDMQFKIFSKYMRNHANHVLRYIVKGSKNPIWMSSVNIPESNLNKTNCPNCGAHREFEFQIQPTLLHFLKFDRFNFGVMAIYTCINDCIVKPESNDHFSNYLPESIVIQVDPFDSA